MAMNSDTKHVLENLNNGRNVSLTKPVRVKVDSMTGETELKHIEKVNKSWKISDDFGNTYTISSLHSLIQWQITFSLWSQYDSRKVFNQTSIYNIDEVKTL